MVLEGEIGIGNEVWEMKRLGEKAEKQAPLKSHNHRPNVNLCEKWT